MKKNYIKYKYNFDRCKVTLNIKKIHFTKFNKLLDGLRLTRN